MSRSRLPLLAAALLATAPRQALHAQADTARAAVRAWRIAHEAGIVREFADLLALPNVAGDREPSRWDLDGAFDAPPKMTGDADDPAL